MSNDAPRSLTELKSHMVSARVRQACIWSGLVLLAVFLPTFVWVCDLWPPTYPVWSAESVKGFFLQDTNVKRVGIAICLAVWSLMVPWGIALASFTARAERGLPILGIVQVVGAASTMTVGELMFLLWGVNLFRPDELSADSMRMFNDLAWFIFVMFWAPGALWCFAVGISVLLDRSANPVFPRWVGYLNIWTGICFFPAALGLFFKEGPFAYNGAITVWLPAGIFFLWYLVMTSLMLRASNDEIARLSAELTELSRAAPAAAPAAATEKSSV
jgi:hypothetical protein